MTFLLIICWDEQTIRNGEAMPERHFILPSVLAPLILGVTAPIKKRSLSTPFLYLFLYTSKENLTPFSSCISPFSSSSQSGFSSRFGKAVSAG